MKRREKELLKAQNEGRTEDAQAQIIKLNLPDISTLPVAHSPPIKKDDDSDWTDSEGSDWSSDEEGK